MIKINFCTIQRCTKQRKKKKLFMSSPQGNDKAAMQVFSPVPFSFILYPHYMKLNEDELVVLQ
jgi:hypothetical protein